MKRPIEALRAFIIDLDGTTYLGNRLIPGADRFFQRVREKNKRFVFYTNNSSATPAMYLHKLRRLGIPARLENILTSATATVMYLKRQNRGRRVFALGTKSFENHLRREGFVLADERCDYVVLAFDKMLTYRKLEKACRMIRDGVAYVATHPDLVCPTPDGDIPDTGAMIAFIEAATGKRPKVIGKPNKTMLDMALQLVSATARETAVIGDRLYTDIKMANDNGLTSILVLSGETKRRPTGPPDQVPDYCFRCLEEIPV
jgi:4-nitrophenyl phosphatase